MKKFLTAFLLIASISNAAQVATIGSSSYYKEWKAFKYSPAFKTTFDNESPVCTIQRDIEIFKQLSLMQRLVRFVFLRLDVVIATPQTMPTLYKYVDTLCKKNGVETPTIFLNRGKGFFNAAAVKFLMSSGGIIIGRKLLKETTDNELEAVIAHEIGHIKYNHTNKGIGLTLAVSIAYYMAKKLVRTKPELDPTQAMVQEAYERFLVDPRIIALLTAFIINKRFEKEADQFAFENDKAEGLSSFCELSIEKRKMADDSFDETYELLQHNSSHLDFIGNVDLWFRYYWGKIGHMIHNADKWIYYNTPVGAHPSPEKRIEAAQKYLACQGQ